MAHPTYVFGAHQIGSMSKEDIQSFLSILKKYGVRNIDTARIYTDSEQRLGEVDAAISFIIDTKAPAFTPQSLTRASITAGLTESLTRLNTDKVDIYYLHGPDATTPIEETVDAIQDLHRQGKFARFGLSNFLAADVRRIHAYATKKGGVVPSVYQGNYNAFARATEKELFPVLRELGMSFYAYSPLAGGFFAKDPDALAQKKAEGRFDEGANVHGGMYGALYNKPAMVEALREWRRIAADVEGETSVMLAYRWAVFHSALDAGKGDAIIVGASRPAQLEQTLKGLEAGPLKKETVERIERLWKGIEKDAPLDNFNSFLKGKLEAGAASRGG
ncbi:Oxidoreductase sirO [Lasiodiplodia hormozganensis]|uniref:Oxidoreductase sirO n=1 Tax=Lasiodiplodia hormozganensis TaxID=869390 RepID=A0AA39X652_9PEZI|nr:Oxidoreductase sirO [Lasiodiplodia hormozganensis]